MLKAVIVGALATCSLIACAQESGAPAASSTSDSAATAAASAAASPAPAPAAATTLDTAAQAQETSDGEAAEPRDTSIERLAAMPADAQLPGGRWVSGKNYQPISPAQPTDAEAGKVEVDEIFWYGCAHCYALEPYIASWLKNKPAYIDFVRVPVIWGPVQLAHARLYYTLEDLNRADLHQKVFDEIHQKRNMLVAPDGNEARSRDIQASWAAANGIPKDEFLKVYDSFNVNAQLQRAEQTTRRYRVDAVPEIIIAGKYSTDVGMAGNPSDLLALINDLAASEKRR